jgi:superoxide dismutase, Cu-Zn family
MKKTLGLGLLMLLVAVSFSMTGCSGSDRGGPVSKAIAVLTPTQGSKVQGVVSFIKERNGVRVVASLDGLSPGLHGFHIHEYGDCSSHDANSAGGHFNPANMPHGAPDADKRHAGDLGNIQADNSGNGKYNAVNSMVALDGTNSVIGRAVVVHAQADDFKTQPTGASGARLACGIIGIAKE